MRVIDGHEVEIEFDGFIPGFKLIHPDDGSDCVPAEGEAEGCWLTDWLENEGWELLRGKLTLPVKWELDGDKPIFHLAAPTPPALDAEVREELEQIAIYLDSREDAAADFHATFLRRLASHQPESQEPKSRCDCRPGWDGSGAHHESDCAIYETAPESQQEGRGERSDFQSKLSAEVTRLRADAEDGDGWNHAMADHLERLLAGDFPTPPRDVEL